jgi:hypothetical protein
VTKNIKVEGLKEAQRNFDKALKNVESYTARALVDVVLDLTGKAVSLAPVDTGDLRSSGFATINGQEVARGKEDGTIESQRPNFKERNLQGEVAFSSVYAFRQHEELEWNHPQGGQAKYLEDPFKKNIDKYIKRLADSTKKAVE